jgi:hypothetical protein
MGEPRRISSSPFGYSEEDMAKAFQSVLSENGLPEVGVFSVICPEILCRQGRPDFIALRYISASGKREHRKVPGLVGPAILQSLKPRAPRTLEFLVSRLKFSRDSVRKSLRQLIEREYVEQLEGGAYRLADMSDYQTPEIWTFELKLNNPKRAVFQAQQSRTYAERAIIVVPPGQEKNYRRFEATMRRWHIGLATFDPLTRAFRFVRKGRRARALSPSHQLYTLSQLSAGHLATYGVSF